MSMVSRIGAEQEDEGSGWRKREMVTLPEVLRIEKRTLAWQDILPINYFLNL